MLGYHSRSARHEPTPKPMETPEFTEEQIADAVQQLKRQWAGGEPAKFNVVIDEHEHDKMDRFMNLVMDRILKPA